MYASSSSVYGCNKKVPYSTDDKVDNPVSLYAATKEIRTSCWLMPIAKLYNIPSPRACASSRYTARRAARIWHISASPTSCAAAKPLRFSTTATASRDFTYVDDIVEGVRRIMQRAPEKTNGEDGLPLPPYRVYNIGNSQSGKPAGFCGHSAAGADSRRGAAGGL